MFPAYTTQALTQNYKWQRYQVSSNGERSVCCVDMQLPVHADRLHGV